MTFYHANSDMKYQPVLSDFVTVSSKINNSLSDEIEMTFIRRHTEAQLNQTNPIRIIVNDNPNIISSFLDDRIVFELNLRDEASTSISCSSFRFFFKL